MPNPLSHSPPRLAAIALAWVLGLSGLPASAAPDAAAYREWIGAMKQAARGPFSRIRWFCQDGTVLPPEPEACREHGGGVQHGEWSERTLALHAAGYRVANVLAGLDPEAAMAEADFPSSLDQILIEQFLIAVDDGWILRRARAYRGALQAEDEAAGARRLLLALSGDREWATRRFLALRTAARLLPHGKDTPSVARVRQVSADLADRDPGFNALRNKIHAKPDAGDAQRVRAYARQVRDLALAADYHKLAAAIDQVYAAPATVDRVLALARRVEETPVFAEVLRAGADSLKASTTEARRLASTGRLMRRLREHFAYIPGAEARLAALDLSLALELEHFQAAARLGEGLPLIFEGALGQGATFQPATRLRTGLAGATRGERLAWLRAAAEASYGAGLLSHRELDALLGALSRLQAEPIGVELYKSVIDDLGRAPGWGTQWLRFQFGQDMRHLADVEPKAALFMQDQLRASPLLFYARVLDGLSADANRMAGVRQVLFGEAMGAGLRPLNPGLARGPLRLAHTRQAPDQFDPKGIYVLPETVQTLPPVAGILTAGEGNPLSHVQLLARNLGIPNVAVDLALLPRLAPHAGQRVLLAVSPGGSVTLEEDAGEATGEAQPPETLIRPDLAKLELGYVQLTPLKALRAADSGRVAGPKAAKLGELYHHYPEAVADGLLIPFGVFRRLLDQPMPGEGKSVFEWMVQGYRALEAMTPGSEQRRTATEAFRARLYAWILGADPGQAFREALRGAMDRTFGPDGGYGVFVRSDTNVEDLPGFTGAGLNLTVPNVVGFENVLQALNRVWASPFTARAFAWRQAHMAQPEHVYPAVLLLRSVPSEKSGVLVTQDIDSGDPHWLSVAVNEGVGGAVDGQAAETLRVSLDTGEVRLLASATAPVRRTLNPQGGVERLPASGSETVLTEAEIARLIRLARELPSRFPPITDAAGRPAPADVEFGFVGGKLRLFQIRPFLESERARSSVLLNAMDRTRSAHAGETVPLDAVP